MSRTRSARLPRSFITLCILFHLHSTHKLKEEICVDGFEQPPKSEQLLKKKKCVYGSDDRRSYEQCIDRGNFQKRYIRAWHKKLLWHLGVRTFQLHHTNADASALQQDNEKHLNQTTSSSPS